MTIINDDSRVINKLEASLTDDARVVIYDRNMFIVQASDLFATPSFRNYTEGNVTQHCKMEHNGKESYVNITLDGCTYPGQKLSAVYYSL
jgi:hypothetical protein